MILKLGNQGPDVAALIDDLRTLGFALPKGSVFDTVVKQSVEAFQVRKVDASGIPLVVDGKVGPLTRWALNAQLHGLTPVKATFALPPLPDGGSAAGRAALQIAMNELDAGHGEEGSDNRGPFVRQYLNGKVAEGSSWCAGFVSFCFREAVRANCVFGYVVGAQGIHNIMKNKGHAYAPSLGNPPQPGDIITWRRVDPAKPKETAWMGHVGIVHSFADGVLWTIEGNRGPYPSKVSSFRYPWSTLVASTGDMFKGLYGLSRHP